MVDLIKHSGFRFRENGEGADELNQSRRKRTNRRPRGVSHCGESAYQITTFTEHESANQITAFTEHESANQITTFTEHESASQITAFTKNESASQNTAFTEHESEHSIHRT